MNVPTTATSPVSDHLRLSIVAYFVVHLILAILCDAQAVALFKYPEPLERLLEWHIEKNGDFLMAERPVWFKSLICGELLLQVTTFIPIYGEVARMILAASYFPFLIIPAGIVIVMWTAGPAPFTALPKHKAT